MAVDFGDPLRRPWVKSCIFILWRGSDTPEHLRCRRLIEACVRGIGSERIKKPNYTNAIDVGCIDRLLPRRSNKALGSEVIDFVKFCTADQAVDAINSTQVAIYVADVASDPRFVKPR